MKLFGFEFGAKKVEKAATLNGVDDSRAWLRIFDWRPGAWQANEVAIDPQAVLANWAVFSCMTLIAGDIGKLRFRLMEKLPNGIKQEKDSPAFSPVLRKPNPYQTWQKFVESWMFSKLSNGNTYVLLERDARRIVVAMHVLEPTRVRPLVADNGDVFYQLGDDELAGLPSDVPAAPASEIIHDRMWCLFHPLVGLSPIFASGLAATQGLKIQGNSTKFFENMSRPSGVLSAPSHIADDTAARLKKHWEDNFSGEKIGRVAVLGDGLKYEGMSVNAVDSQMVEQLKLTAEMVCSTMHVPAFKAGIGPIPPYQNAQVLNQIYYSDCLQTLIESVENSLDEGLSLAGTGYCVEADLDDLLRMDSKTLIETLKQADGIMAPDEQRFKLNLPPVPGGKLPYKQQQEFSLEALAKRDAQGDPFATPGAAPAPAPEPAPAPTQADQDESQKQMLAEMLDRVLEAREMEHAESLARATEEVAIAMSNRQRTLDSFSRMLHQ